MKTADAFQIAALHLNFETLETRNSDSLDFREVSVWGVRAALDAAYELGRATALAQAKEQEALASVHIKSVDSLGNVAYLHRSAKGSVRCSLSNNTPAGLEYCGIAGDQVAASIRIAAARSAADVLAAVRAVGYKQYTYSIFAVAA